MHATTFTQGLKIASLLLVTLLTTACGGNGNTSSGGGTDQSRTVSVNVIGEWVGNASLHGQTEYFILDLRQSPSNQVSGHLYSRAGGSHDYRFSGRIAGHSLSLSGEDGETARFSLEADATASFLTGTISQSGSSQSVSFERL